MTERCDVPGCPRADEHFPIMQVVLPMGLRLAARLMQAMSDGCEKHGITAVFIDLPDHGNGRIYASTKERP